MMIKKKRNKNMYWNKKKLKGYVLIEVMLAFSLGTMLLLMIYKTYNSITNSVNFLKNTNDLNIEKIIFNFNARRDFCELYTPLEIDLIYYYK